MDQASDLTWRKNSLVELAVVARCAWHAGLPRRSCRSGSWAGAALGGIAGRRAAAGASRAAMSAKPGGTSVRLGDLKTTFCRSALAEPDRHVPAVAALAAIAAFLTG